MRKIRLFNSYETHLRLSVRSAQVLIRSGLGYEVALVDTVEDSRGDTAQKYIRRLLRKLDGLIANAPAHGVEVDLDEIRDAARQET